MVRDVENLLLLQDVVRQSSFSRAAGTLGTSHTTVSRRIAALEKAAGAKLLIRSGDQWAPTNRGQELIRAAEEIEQTLSSIPLSANSAPNQVTGVVRALIPEAFGGVIVGEPMRAVTQRHPQIRLEMINSTSRERANPVGIDLEILLGRPAYERSGAFHLTNYALGVYASREYLQNHSPLQTPAQVQDHPLIYYVESVQSVPELAAPIKSFPEAQQIIGATSPMVHVELTKSGAGIGILPCFLASRSTKLVRLFAADLSFRAQYWVLSRPDLLRRPAVQAVVSVIRETVARMQNQLLGTAEPA